jgi:HPt (histidine-containing phosphotransfer) domain-containing protein
MGSAEPTNAPVRSDFATDPDMSELVEMFVSEMPDRVAALREHFDRAELSEVQRLAHQLKGASAGYGFRVVGEAAADLEQKLKQGVDEVEQLRAEFDELVDLCSRVAP